MKTTQHKDGVDELWPTVDAEDWREALELRTPGTTFRCRDGWTITFGDVLITPAVHKPAD